MFLLDGEACPDGTGRLDLDDPALWTGLAVFETLRTYGRAPFRPEVHLERLAASASFCGIAFDDASRGRALDELQRVADGTPGESKLNVLLTAGGRRIVRAEALDLSRAGAPVRVASRRWAPDPWLPGWVKHTSRAAWVLAARQAGVDEVLWVADADSGGGGGPRPLAVAPAGVWTEANRSNLFVVRDGVFCTPPDDGRILQGVTRTMMLEAARSAGVPVHDRDPVAVGPVEEMYLAATLKELAPVVELDGAPGAGPGPVGARVLAAFREAARRASERG